MSCRESKFAWENIMQKIPFLPVQYLHMQIIHNSPLVAGSFSCVFQVISMISSVWNLCVSDTEHSSIQTLGSTSQQGVCSWHLWFTKALGVFFVIFIYFLLNKHSPRSSVKDTVQVNLKINILHSCLYCSFKSLIALKYQCFFITLPIAKKQSKLKTTFINSKMILWAVQFFLSSQLWFCYSQLLNIFPTKYC